MFMTVWLIDYLIIYFLVMRTDWIFEITISYHMALSCLAIQRFVYLIQLKYLPFYALFCLF